MQTQAPALAGLQAPRRAASQESCAYDHVDVTVERVRLLRMANGKPTWTELAPAQPTQVDLLGQGGGVLQQLGLDTLGPGNYAELRLILAPDSRSHALNVVQPTGGPLAPLRVPAGAQTGLRLAGDLVVPAGGSADLAVTLTDLCDALMQVGKPSEPSYLLRHDLRATLQLLPPTPSAPESIVPLPGGAMFVPTLAPGFIVTVIDAGFPLQVYGGGGTLAGQVLVPFLVNEADTPHGRLVQLSGGGFAGVGLGGPLGPCVEWYANPPGGPSPCRQNVWTQAFTPTGASIDGQTQLGSSVPYDVPSSPPAFPAIAPLADGGYVVVWQQGSAAGVNEGVWARRFNADGTPQGAARLVWMDSSGYLEVVGLTTGGYAVAGNGKVAAFSASDGLLWQAAPSPAFYWTGTQQLSWRGEASLAALPGGGLVIAWNNNGYTSVVQFTAAGAVVAGGSGTTVDDSTSGMPQHSSAVALGLPDGGYVVGWVEDATMMARRFAADGSPAGPATRVDVVSHIIGSPTYAALLANGAFVLSWGGTVSTAGGRVEQWVRQFPAGALVGPP